MNHRGLWRHSRGRVGVLKARHKLGKYRIENRISEGGFASVYQAYDTIEGVRVALKIPTASTVNPEMLKDFRNEVRLASKLVHPNILPIKDASIIDGTFVIVLPLGEKTLADRFANRLSLDTVLNYTGQMLEAVAFAHRHKIIHCDVKPENMLLFADKTLKLTDFGIAKIAFKTVRGSGTGTMGYMAPEQAMGKPSFHSDVFSLGLIIYRMLSGEWPEWPFTWPPPGYKRVRGRVPAEFIAWLKRSMDLLPKKRFRNAEQMLAEFHRLLPLVHEHTLRRRKKVVG